MFSKEGVQTCSKLLSSGLLEVRALEERKELRPHLSRQCAPLSQPCLWVVSPPLVGEQIGWGRGVRLHGLVMAQTRVQSPGSPQTARGGGRKERLGVAEFWEKERWAGPGEKRRKLAPMSSGEESWGRMATRARN